MLRDKSSPNWTVRIMVLSAAILAVPAGLLVFGKASAGTQSPAVVATTCSGFETDARDLFNKSNTATLTGTFVRGDRVTMTIEFDGPAYWWDLKFVDWTSNGVLAKAEKAEVTNKLASSLSASLGGISGHAKWDIEIDVNATGRGAIKFDKSTMAPLLTAPKVTSASCTSTKIEAES